jgi:preprotein translocase subunit SecG
MGGQSAFGTKAGDTFTKITIWTAVVWILLCVVAVKYLSTSSQDALGERGGSTSPAGMGEPEKSPDDKPTGEKPATPASPASKSQAPAATPPKSDAPVSPPPAPAPPADSK